MLLCVVLLGLLIFCFCDCMVVWLYGCTCMIVADLVFSFSLSLQGGAGGAGYNGDGIGWTNDQDVLERAGAISKTTLPASRLYNKGMSNSITRPNPANVFNQNAERRGESFRSGKDVNVMLHEERKKKRKNTPYVLPMKIDMSVRNRNEY